MKQLNAQINGAAKAAKLIAGSVAVFTSYNAFCLIIGGADGDEIPKDAARKMIVGIINKGETEEGLTKMIKNVVKAIKKERGQGTPAIQVTDQTENGVTRKLLEVYGKHLGCEMELCTKK